MSKPYTMQKARSVGEHLGRKGISEAIIQAVESFDGSHKGAVELAGQLSFWADAATFDCYWREKMEKGILEGIHQSFKLLDNQTSPQDPEISGDFMFWLDECAVKGAQDYKDSLTRDKAREIFNENLCYSDITQPDLIDLYRLLDEHMISSGRYQGKYKTNPTVRWKGALGRLKEAYITCRSTEWNNRECISFSHDGFIGFAGWADSENIKPVLAGFVQWCGLMMTRKGGAL